VHDFAHAQGASNFPGWADVPLRDLISAGCGGRPAHLANDADAAAAAELWVGAAAGEADMVLVTLGTGIGVAVALGGRVITGATGTIEGGHHIVQAVGGRACGCGQSGCLEAYCSASSVAKIAAEALAGGRLKPSSSLRALTTDMLSCEAIFDAALAGDRLLARTSQCVYY
jgi:glucokinase